MQIPPPTVTERYEFTLDLASWRYQSLIAGDYEDIGHSAWLKVEARLAMGATVTHYSAYVGKTLHRCYLDYVDRRKIETPYGIDGEIPKPRETSWPSRSNDPESYVISVRLRRVLESCARKLSPSQAEVVQHFLANGGRRPAHWTRQQSNAFSKAKARLKRSVRLRQVWLDTESV